MSSTEEQHVYPEGYTNLHFKRQQIEAVARNAQALNRHFNERRSVRHFSSTPIPSSIIEDIIMSASSAPSGAHHQPWTFVAVSDPVVKSKIRVAAEEEERLSYEQRMPKEWREALEPLGTDAHKPFLEQAPWLVIIFAQNYAILPDGTHRKNYYVSESVGIAAGHFIAAVHQAGLACLTHTPSPMKFLSEILARPVNEKPYLLLPVGYPADDCQVPAIVRKGPDEVVVFMTGEPG
ncbi:nitroreductase family protein [Candidatus Neomarinimicrobiota bacterium]